jgi:hypothetical protein
MESIAPSSRNIRNTYTKRPIIDYRLYMGLRNMREPTDIYFNDTAGDIIRGERIVYAGGY